jgi:biopolymer transport protein ExbD
MADFTPKGKNAPTVDMTPMVDLGFLLITFFMLASSFMSPKIIKMLSPADTDDFTTAPPLKCSKSLTLIVDASNKVKYYTCPESSQPDSIDFSAKGLRKLVLDRQQEVQAQWGDKKELIVLLKLTPNAPYKQLVDAIDEMNLTQSTFIMAHLDKQDSTVMKW